jgi:hypothetical protein
MIVALQSPVADSAGWDAFVALVVLAAVSFALDRLLGAGIATFAEGHGQASVRRGSQLGASTQRPHSDRRDRNRAHLRDADRHWRHLVILRPLARDRCRPRRRRLRGTRDPARDPRPARANPLHRVRAPRLARGGTRPPQPDREPIADVSGGRTPDLRTEAGSPKHWLAVLHSGPRPVFISGHASLTACVTDAGAGAGQVRPYSRCHRTRSWRPRRRLVMAAGKWPPCCGLRPGLPAGGW